MGFFQSLTVALIGAAGVALVESILCLSDGVAQAPHLPAVALAVFAAGFAILFPVCGAIGGFSSRGRFARTATVSIAFASGFAVFSILSRTSQLDPPVLALVVLVGVVLGGFFGWTSIAFLEAHDSMRAGFLAFALSLPWLAVLLSGGAWRERGIVVSFATLGIAFCFLFMTMAASSRLRTNSMRLASLLLASLLLAVSGIPAFWIDKVEPRVAEVSPPDSATHIFVVSVDTLRYDAVSEEADSVPNIRALAQDSVELTQARAPAPWTLPSVASMMTGLSPMAHGSTEIDRPLASDFSTLAEVFREAGFATAAVGTNPVLHPDSGVSQGFDHYDFFPRLKKWDSIGAQLIRWIAPDHFRKSASTRVLTDRAIAWTNRNRRRNSFLWLHYYDPHLPYSPPLKHLQGAEPPEGIDRKWNMPFQVRAGMERFSQEQREWLRTLYDAELRYVDHEIGRLIASLRELGIYEKSLIVFTSDHGEEFWEHGSFEHGHTLHEEVLRVPLFFKLPGSRVAEKIGVPVSITSVYPTVLDIAGLEHPAPDAGAPSLVASWSPSEEFVGRPPVSTGLLYYEDRVSVVLDGFKYIQRFVSGSERLYDLTDDPWEQRSVLDLHPERVEAARAAVEAHRHHAERSRHRFGADVATNAPINKQVLEQLRAVGYVE